MVEPAIVSKVASARHPCQTLFTSTKMLLHPGARDILHVVSTHDLVEEQELHVTPSSYIYM